ncbi:branched-chain amino acid ABC transporter permease [Dactylosporangium sp. CA-092794]|uniref:branched-chain amino acid ABC transporter permease n=1 Tax=Dactylosporangium sp. CA-092794 TaxID=3239929 RepID=UPI003D8D90A7
MTATTSTSDPSVASVHLARVVAGGWQPLVLLLLIVFGTPLFGRSDVYPLLILAGIYGIAVVGVSVLAGLGGQLTLGHAVFMAMGAYASALCTVRWGLPAIVGVAAGVGCALLLALVTSPILRLRGWYLAMATIALAYILQRVLVNLHSLTGGNNGLYGIPAFSIAGWTVQGDQQYFILAWTLTLVCFVLGRNIARSRYGRSLSAIHKDANAAATLGINPVRAKAVLWLIASVPAAVAGSVFAHYSAFIAPGDFTFATSLVLFAAVIIGGARSIFAGLVAVTFLVTMPAYSSGHLTGELMEATAMIVVYLTSPDGVAGIVDAGRRRLAARSGRDA